jgi:hypothetical protein
MWPAHGYIRYYKGLHMYIPTHFPPRSKFRLCAHGGTHGKRRHAGKITGVSGAEFPYTNDVRGRRSVVACTFGKITVTEHEQQTDTAKQPWNRRGAVYIASERSIVNMVERGEAGLTVARSYASYDSSPSLNGQRQIQKYRKAHRSGTSFLLKPDIKAGQQVRSLYELRQILVPE